MLALVNSARALSAAHTEQPVHHAHLAQQAAHVEYALCKPLHPLSYHTDTLVGRSRGSVSDNGLASLFAAEAVGPNVWREDDKWH